MAELKSLWSEKYRPDNLDSYIFQNNKHKAAFTKMVSQQSIPHLLLSGVQGSGKTTIARILIKELDLCDTDVLTINGSDENNVDTVRDKIKNFVRTYALGPFKVVNIEEFDYFSLNGQAILRSLMEDYEGVARFILTCNYENKIMPAIKSRCQQFRFKSVDSDDVAEMLVRLLATEKVKFTLEQLDKFVSVGYPDIRKIINLVQQHTIAGTLTDPQSETSTDYKFDIMTKLEEDDWESLRRLVCEHVVTEEWVDVYQFLYKQLHKSPKFADTSAWEEGILIIAEHLYKHGIVADPEINATAMFIRLKNVK